MDSQMTGTVTFLFTDVEGSTKLWESEVGAMRVAMARHDALIEQVISAHGGTVVHERGEGDSIFAVFTRAADAVTAASTLQWALYAEPWPTSRPIRVRMALHTGEAQLRNEDYYGPAVNRCARLRGIAHGGQTLLSEATAGLARAELPADIELRSLGQHRLKDLSAPEQVYQLLHPSLPAEFPPLKSLTTLPNNLPVQLNSFVGRKKELGEVKRLLGSFRLVTLTGTGGSGKSRLAIQVAADLLDEFPDGVQLVELAPLNDPNLLAQAVASTLGVREAAGRPLTQALATHLQPLKLLLLLDNCEHMIAACASLAEALLRQCPGLRILATSRETLAIPGEISYRVPSLELPDPHRLPPLAQLTAFEAVRLFIERAVAANSAFTVTNRNAPAVAEICHRLDGIPLAIELAAARVKAMTVDDIAVRLTDRFRLLTGGSRTALPRQQTLRALVAWSYDLLSPAEQTLFRRLSVFAGGFSPEAAESICADDQVEGWEVLDLLVQLVEKSLLLTEDDNGRTRYRLMETLRHFGLERLKESGEEALLRRQHLNWFTEQLTEADLKARTSGEHQPSSIDRIDREMGNVRAALEWAKMDPASLETGLLLVGAVRWIWTMRGYIKEGLTWSQSLVALAEGAPTRSRLAALSTWTFLGARVAAAETEDAIRIYRQEADVLGDDDHRGKACFAGAILRWRQHRWEEATALAEEAIVYARRHGEPWILATYLNMLATISVSSGQQERALAATHEAIALSGRLGDNHGLAMSKRIIARMKWQNGQLAEAAALFREALLVSKQLRDRPCGLEAIEGLACLSSKAGDLERTVRLVAAYEVHARAVGVNYRWGSEMEAVLAELRSRLSPEALAKLEAEGDCLTFEDAVDYALEGE